jgi:hypothetical protein
VNTTGTRDGKPLQATHHACFIKSSPRYDISLSTTPEALLQLVQERWSLESWHLIRETQLHEEAHRYRGNGAGAMATLRTAALYTFRMAGFKSIWTSMKAVRLDITALLTMALRQLNTGPKLTL